MPKQAKEKPEPRLFSPALDVEELAKEIIATTHQHLKAQSIAYVFVSEAFKTNGEPVLLKTSKKSGLDAWGWTNDVWSGEADNEGEGDPFFVIVVSKTHWDIMSPKGKAAMLDSHLSMCGVRKKSGALYIAQPDIREFSTVLSRHGLYTSTLKEQGELIKKAILQPELFAEEGGKAKAS